MTEVASERSPRGGTAVPPLARALRDVSYEVMPLDGVEEQVLRHVPPDVPLTVTATERRGIEATLAVAIRLSERGYRVAPHLPARQVSSRAELDAISERLHAAGISRLFVIGGDPAEPAGPYHSSAELLDELDPLSRGFSEVGIAGYPEGHARIPAADLEDALREKGRHATQIISQICFTAQTTVDWATQLTRDGIDLPVHVGVPAPVSRAKLMRISGALGLGASARFLARQSGFWRLLTPGMFDPTKLLRTLAPEIGPSSNAISGFHIFTFNELEGTEAWRQGLLASLG